jgi:hypothetical protein
VQVRFVFGRNVKFGELIKGFKHTRILVWHTASTANTVEPGYNDIGLCDTSSIASDFLWCQLTF